VKNVAKLLFDENFGRPIVRVLASAVELLKADKPTISHFFELFNSGTEDDVWIPKVAEDGWIVVSADRAKRAGGPKLPLLCEQYSVPLVLLSGRLHTSSSFDKLRAVLAVWPALCAIADGPRSCRHSLRCLDSGDGYRLTQVAPTAASTDHGKA
jgi:hypothetical protein